MGSIQVEIEKERREGKSPQTARGKEFEEQRSPHASGIFVSFENTDFQVFQSQNNEATEKIES